MRVLHRRHSIYRQFGEMHEKIGFPNLTVNLSGSEFFIIFLPEEIYFCANLWYDKKKSGVLV